MTQEPGGTDSDLLVRYVQQALERLDRGEPIDPQALCAGHPDLAPRLAEVLGLVDALATVRREAGDGDPLRGEVLAGRYHLQHCLGRGAMGVVYAAEDRQLRRTVAVKILDVRLFRDPVAEQRFQREAETLAALRHPAVVQVHDRGSSKEGIHFLVMELLEGSTLASLQAAVDGQEPLAAAAGSLGQALPERTWWRQCARWGGELARGLAAAHDQGIVHRDVKPSNVFVRTDGRAALLDFGIAARSEDHRLTATATTLGTPWYMAPEQVGAAVHVTAAADIYGLGATLYHLLTGRPPYEGDPAQVLAALPTRDPLPMRAVRPELPKDLVAVVERCLERDPRRRYPSAALLAADLDAFLEHRPVTARPIGRLGRRWRAFRRAPAPALALLAGAIALLLLLVALPLWLGAAGRAREAEWQRLSATLPVLLAVEGQPEQRLVEVLLPDQQQAIATLDRLLELAPDDVPARLFRAAMRLDAGDSTAAAADLGHIAGAGKSPFLRELARRYAAVPAAGRGTSAVDLAGLPEPDIAEAAFVAGFHELRNRHVTGFAERAERLLARAEGYVPARDLRTIALLALTDATTDQERRRALFQEAHDETLRLEVTYGGPTARTQAVRGAALVGLRRYADAVPVLEESLRLRPGRHSPLINLGIAFRRLGRPADAMRVLTEAHAVRPDYWNTCYTLAQLALDTGDLAAARQWAAKVPAAGPGGLAWRQPDLLGTIELWAAVQARGGDGVVMREAASRAVAHYDRALLALGEGGERDRMAVRRAVAQGFLADRLEESVAGFLQMLQREPANPFQVANLAGLLPPALGPAETFWLGVWLRRLVMELADADSALRPRMAAELDELLHRGPPRDK